MQIVVGWRKNKSIVICLVLLINLSSVAPSQKSILSFVMQTRHEQSSDVDVSILYIITRYFVYHVHKVTVFKRSYQEQSQDKAPTAKIYARKRASWCPYWISCRPTTAAPSDIQNHQLLQHSCKPNNHREALSISIKVVAVSEITMKINSAVMTANDLTIHASC